MTPKGDRQTSKQHKGVGNSWVEARKKSAGSCERTLPAWLSQGGGLPRLPAPGQLFAYVTYNHSSGHNIK